MRISWALQVAAVFCLVAVHPAVADSTSNDNTIIHDSIFGGDQNKHIEPVNPILYRRAEEAETFDDAAPHIVNYARMGGLQFNRRGAAADEHERPRPRPGPSRSQNTNVPGGPHLEREPRRRRPAHLTAPGDNHHPKPTPHKPKPDHGKPPKKPDH
ncbi:hypothetical protein BGW39_000553, partial [Mortierella sp. 14UC]